MKPINETSSPTELEPNGLLSLCPPKFSSQNPSSPASAPFSRKCSNLRRFLEFTLTTSSFLELKTSIRNGLKFKIILKPVGVTNEADSGFDSAAVTLKLNLLYFRFKIIFIITVHGQVCH